VALLWEELHRDLGWAVPPSWLFGAELIGYRARKSQGMRSVGDRDMAKRISRSKLGRKAAGSTRNQRRKAEYARKAAEQQSKQLAGKHARKKLRKSVRLVGTRVHQVPCGNHACVSCRGVSR